MSENVGIRQYDVLIIGGGVVGVTLALALASANIRVAIVESQDITQTEPFKQGPALALSKASVNIFNTLNLGPALRAAATPIHTVQVSNAQHFGAVRFSATDLHVDILGLVIPAWSLLTILRTETLKNSAIEWIAPAQLQCLERTDAGYRVMVNLANGEVSTLETHLLVAADGSDSQARHLLGINVKDWDHSQTALLANLHVSQDPANTAYERFASSGPLAALPLAERKFALVWVQNPSCAAVLQQQDDVAFLQNLQRAWGYRLGKLLSVTDRRALSLHSSYALQQIMPGAVLLGNSAHTLHPIAAQGLNLSLRDTAALAEVISEARGVGKNPGSLAVLKKYLTWREPEQMQVMRFTHGLNTIFSSALLPVALARNAGLCSIGLAPAVTQWLALQAMGLSGQLPKLVSGVKL